MASAYLIFLQRWVVSGFNQVNTAYVSQMTINNLLRDAPVHLVLKSTLLLQEQAQW